MPSNSVGYPGSEIKVVTPGLVCIPGSFAPAGSSTPTDLQGVGFTVAYGATGIYTVTLAHKYVALVACPLALALSADADVQVLLAAVDVASAKTIIIHAVKTSDGTTGVEIAANAANRIHFCAWLRQSNLSK